ncbi:hypothetical protein D3C81_2319270 [compost metagenome]
MLALRIGFLQLFEDLLQRRIYLSAAIRLDGKNVFFHLFLIVQLPGLYRPPWRLVKGQYSHCILGTQ